jgi:YidC/Oxa1 family membrane protein insertase
VNIWHQFVGFFKTAVSTLADFYSFLGNHRWAAAIITLTIIVRTLLLPLAVKQIRSMRDTQRLQPEVARLRQKYKNDRQKQMAEIQQLYQREGINPMASCLPMVAQMPVFIGMYQGLRQLPHVAMPFLGLGDLRNPANTSVAGWLLIVLMTLAQLFTTMQLNPGQTDSQKRMQLIMPLFFVFIFMKFPAALVLYWATQSLYQLVQQIIMTRDMRKDAGGWRALLPWHKPDPKSVPKAPREPKPQVRAPAPALASSPSVPASSAFDPLAARRSIDEKRARRRRNKKKRKK